MQEIKFRAWDNINKCWLDLEKLFMKEVVLDWVKFETDVTRNIFKLRNRGGDIEWQQYTGLKDKNGKEIFEGDIVQLGIWAFAHHSSREDSFKNKEVIWDPLKGCWRYGYSLLNPDIYTRPEVIGNIYENPELLE